MNVILKGQLSYVNSYYAVIGITGKDNLYFEEISKRENVRVIPVNFHRKISLFSDLLCLLKIIIILRKEKPHIVHTQTPKAGFLGMMASWLMHVPVRMHSEAGLPVYNKFHGIKKWIMLKAEKLTLFFANSIYPNSAGLKSFLIDNNLCNPLKVRLIGNGSSNGIDLEYFSPSHFDNNFKILFRNELKIPQDAFVFSFVGRIVRDKGIHELAEAFVKLAQIPGLPLKVYLIVVGPRRKTDDPVSPEVLNLLNTHEKIRYTDLQRDVRPYLSISNAFVFPSYREGLPGAVLQACTMGLPAIVTDITGCNEIVVNEVNGVTIEPKDADALFNAMLKFVQQPDLTNKYRKEARRIIAEKYDQKKYWQKLVEEYQMMINKYVS
jgi:glycosyltransferase involved in cell wall biosynthesis